MDNVLGINDFSEEISGKFNRNITPEQAEFQIVDNFQKGKITEEIFEGAFDVLQKARSTRYLRREGGPGNYRYIYKEAEVKNGSSVSEDDLAALKAWQKRTPIKETNPPAMEVGTTFYIGERSGGGKVTGTIKSIEEKGSGPGSTYSKKFQFETTDPEGSHTTHSFDKNILQALWYGGVLEKNGWKPDDKGDTYSKKGINTIISVEYDDKHDTHLVVKQPGERQGISHYSVSDAIIRAEH